MANVYLIKAITIAVRHSACRKQFGANDDGEESPVLEYQSQQYRLLPHLAITYVQKIFCHWLFDEHYALLMATLAKDKSIGGANMEMHALSSAAKPICTWQARDAIQDCRESCGGHGYLKSKLYFFFGVYKNIFLRV